MEPAAVGHQPSGCRVIILGAGRPYRGVMHSVLQETTRSTRVLDWILAAFDPQVATPHFVGGYAVDEVRARYPRLRISENPDWETTKSAWSLVSVPTTEAPWHYVTYADILYHPSAIATLAAVEGEIVVAVDSTWRHRYAGRSIADLERSERVRTNVHEVTRLGPDIPLSLSSAEFIGLARLSGAALAALQRMATADPAFFRGVNLSGALEALRLHGWAVRAVDIAGEWAELNEPRDVAHFVLGTKAETLSRLRNVVVRCRIEDQVTFTVSAWHTQREELARVVRDRFDGAPVVVRSSALSEDGFHSSHAGEFKSILNIPASDTAAFAAAVDQVISSYGDDPEHHQVLVQPMVRGVRASGVLFTRTLTHGAPYYVVNYDDSGPATDTITSGSADRHRTWIVQRACADAVTAPSIVTRAVDAARELEALLHFDSLDIEFAATDAEFVVLQVRPIAAHSEAERPDDREFEHHLRNATTTLVHASARPPHILGDAALFGIMPDWNPAEIIGTTPNALATSLYRYLIMDETWATQRAEFGYRDVRPHPLLVMIGGHPYVDVRASFNSFVPATLPHEVAERLVNAYLARLREHPEYHDKVEFEVVPTCFAFDWVTWEERLRPAGLSTGELDGVRDALRELTARALDTLPRHHETLERLSRRFDALRTAPLPPMRSAALMLDDAKRLGALPFAHLARLGFVAATLLRSGVRARLVDERNVDRYLRSVRTVTHEFTDDAYAVRCGDLDFDVFVERYGHLRPGTYDILSPSYRDDPARFLRPVVDSAAADHDPSPGPEVATVPARLAAALRTNGIDAEPETLDRFLRGAIDGRERSKFLFTRNLSAALDGIAAFGHEVGLHRWELAGLGIHEIGDFDPGLAFDPARLAGIRQSAERSATTRRLALMTELPPLIDSVDSLEAFAYPATAANFVGVGHVVAPCVVIDAQDRDATIDLGGRIALIDRADPGFDWLFGHAIAGLVTMYGGANSHMAIRCAEFGIPAAIGVGETRFRSLERGAVLELNAANRQLLVVR